jgi:hypothetical protein
MFMTVVISLQALQYGDQDDIEEEIQAEELS